MRKRGFWAGIFALAVLAPAVLIATSIGDPENSGHVKGRVTYNGEPVKGGSIMFVSEDRERSDDKAVMIDEQGRYDCGTHWRRSWSHPTRFRICVILDGRKYPPKNPQAGAITHAEVNPGKMIKSWPFHGGGTASPDPGPGAAVPAAFEWPHPEDEMSQHRRFSHVEVTDLVVQLGPEPALINVALKE
jgi:hypothetical protein